MRSDSNTTFSTQHNGTNGLTPRELIKYHIEHPEVPITDKDIENLVLNDFPALSNKREAYQSYNDDNGITLSGDNSSSKLMLF